MYNKKLMTNKGRIMRMKKKRNLKETKIFRNMGKRFGLCLTGLLLTASMLTGCGGSSKSMYWKWLTIRADMGRLITRR